MKNRVLRLLRPNVVSSIRGKLVNKALAAGDVIYEEGAPFTHAIFPHSGVLSLLARMDDGKQVEKVSIGVEGFLGLALVMGGGGSLSRTVVQVPGEASWLSIHDLDEALDCFPCVREAMLRYAKALIVQLMESVACNSCHTASERVSRWLLFASDRTKGGDIRIKQQALADAMGLRRATVSSICSDLQKNAAIDYSRGRIRIADRRILLAHSCSCYERISKASLLNQEHLL